MTDEELGIPAPTMMTSRSSNSPLSARFALVVLIWSHSFEDSRATAGRTIRREQKTAP